jgi:predicted branched-subunit amino acid permease
MVSPNTIIKLMTVTEMRRAASTIAAVAASIGVYGMAFGALAASMGIEWWLVALLGIFVNAGAAQAVFLTTAADGGLVAAVSSALMVNVRLVLYGAAARQAVSPATWPESLAAAHVASDETIAIAATSAPSIRRRVFWWAGAVFLVVWVVSTASGAVIGTAIDASMWGLDAAFPAVFVVLMASLLSTAMSRAAAVAAAVTTVTVTGVVPAGMPIVCAVAAGVGVAVIVRLLGRERGGRSIR